MNYILQLNAFLEQAELNNDLRPMSRLVYIALFKINNSIGWKSNFQATYGQVLSITGISDVKTYYKAINELTEKGYIIYKKSKNQYQAATFELRILHSIINERNISAPPINGGAYPIVPLHYTEEHTQSTTLSTPNILKHINNKHLNNKEGALPTELAVSIIDYLNVKAGSIFRASTPKTYQLIAARVKEGYQLEDFKKVIDIKCGQWLTDVAFSKYLRPETLFSNKFEGYLNETKAKERPKKLVM